MITLPPPSCRLLSTNPCLMHPLLLLFFSFFLRFKFELYSFLCSSHLDAERHIDEWERIGGARATTLFTGFFYFQILSMLPSLSLSLSFSILSSPNSIPLLLFVYTLHFDLFSVSSFRFSLPFSFLSPIPSVDPGFNKIFKIQH